MEFKRMCPCCGKVYSVHMPEDAYIKWQAGELIQNAWPDAKPEAREMVISGICLDCQGEVFDDEL